MLRRITVAASALALLLAGCSDDKADTKPRIRILATTDEHSHLLAVGPERDEWPLPSATTVRDGELKGGIARRATVFESERADGVPTVVLSNGDFSQGTLSAVAFTVANFDATLMRQLGYDAVALGNHEFDSLPSGLAASIAAAKSMGGAPPFVLTNALNTTGTAIETLYGDVGSGKDIVKGLIVEKEGIRVGIVSAVGPSAAYDVQYQAAPVTFSTASTSGNWATYVAGAITSMAAILQPTIDQLRDTEGADVVVLLFHGGIQTATSPNGDVGGIVSALTGVDLVIGGHTHGTFDAVQLVNDLGDNLVPVVQPAAYGNEVARVEFTVSGGVATFDTGRTAFIAVDDRLPPTADAEIRLALQTVITGIEASVLPATLQAVTGSAIRDNPVVAGDLYFYPLGTTAFDVTGATLRAETNALNLDTDAMLAVANEVGYAADVALQNAGSIRGDLLVGDTGTLAFSDVFRMVSLGADPWEQSPGYPLIRAYIPLTELWGAFEQTLQLSYLNNDYYLGSAGLAIEWDPSRTAFDPVSPGPLGWIRKLTVGATTYYDVSLNDASGWLVDPAPIRVSVVTTLLVASFAGNMGVHLFASGDTVGDTTPVTDLSALIVEWPSTAHVKDHQALGAYIRDPTFGMGGVMDAAYAEAMPVRATCSRATTDNPLFPCPYP